MKKAQLLAKAAAVVIPWISAGGIGNAADPSPSPWLERAPIEQYRMASATEEAAVARSAAPPSIADHAQVLTLGVTDYDVAAPGDNGFVCLVERAWASGLSDPAFWNPKIRGPICYNPAGARSVLAKYLERTRWVLAGVPKSEIVARTRAAIATGRYLAPAPGAMALMLSRRGLIGDDAAGPWRPHIMVFLPSGGADRASEWGANMPGAPVLGGADDVEPVVTFFVPVRKWSDGTPDADPPPSRHTMPSMPATQ